MKGSFAGDVRENVPSTLEKALKSRWKACSNEIRTLKSCCAQKDTGGHSLHHKHFEQSPISLVNKWLLPEEALGSYILVNIAAFDSIEKMQIIKSSVENPVSSSS